MSIAQQGINEELQGGRELNYIAQRDVYSGSLFTRILDAVNTLAKNAGVSAIGKVSPPPPVDSINVSGPVPSGGIQSIPNSEILHWTIQHNQSVSKGIHYFSEVDTSPAFTNPHVIHHGTSRSGFLSLPTNNGSNVKQTYYLRSYAQYPGSDPTPPSVFGGLAGPYGIQMGGSSQTSLLPSTGSGTARPNGSQGGQGFGEVLTRPAPQAKRQSKLA
jgi:hypothetical protein